MKNRYRSLLILLILVTLVITYIVGKLFLPLRFWSLIPIGILLGIGFASIFRKVVPIKNVITFLVVSLFLGLFLNTLIIFFLGVLEVNIGISFFVWYVPILCIFNIVIFFVNTDEKLIQDYVKNTKLELIDYLWLAVFFILLVLFTNTCLEAFFPSWDSFTYWALDSKYIFENSHLRDGNFALLANNYLSFFPLQINYIYLLYGAIVEQTAGMLSVIYAYIGVFLVFSYLIDFKKSTIKKSLIYLSLVVALYSFFTTHYVLLMNYADVFLSIVILFYVLILFNKNFSTKNYWMRFLLLTFLSLTLYFTKTHYLVMTIYLLGFFVLYDAKYVIKHIKEIVREPLMIVTVLVLFFYVFCVGKYAQSISNEGEFVSGIVSKVVLNSTLLVNLKNVVKHLFTEIPLFVLSFCLLLIGAFFSKKGFTKNDVLRITFLIILMALPTSLYVLNILNLSDLSLLRYLGLSYFALALLSTDILPDVIIESKWQEIIAGMVIFCVPVLLIGQIWLETGFDLKFTPHSGGYKDFEFVDKSGVNRYFFPQKEYYDLSEEVLNNIPSKASILVLDYVDEQNQIANTFPPGLFIRYYLSKNNLGGPYSCLPEYCYSYFMGLKPDYLVLYSYENYWPECNGILEKGKSYLIKFDLTDEILKSGRCVATSENLTIL